MSKTDGRHALVEFSKNWLEDASRRDFTINVFIQILMEIYLIHSMEKKI